MVDFDKKISAFYNELKTENLRGPLYDLAFHRMLRRFGVRVVPIVFWSKNAAFTWNLFVCFFVALLSAHFMSRVASWYLEDEAWAFSQSIPMAIGVSVAIAFGATRNLSRLKESISFDWHSCGEEELTRRGR